MMFRKQFFITKCCSASNEICSGKVRFLQACFFLPVCKARDARCLKYAWCSLIKEFLCVLFSRSEEINALPSPLFAVSINLFLFDNNYFHQLCRACTNLKLQFTYLIRWRILTWSVPSSKLFYSRLFCARKFLRLFGFIVNFFRLFLCFKVAWASTNIYFPPSSGMCMPPNLFCTFLR